MGLVATATVIRGKGECEVYMNGLVNQEIQRMNKEHAAEIKAIQVEADAMKKNRDALRETEKRRTKIKKESLADRLRERISVAWAVFFALALEWKLIKKAEEEDE